MLKNRRKLFNFNKSLPTQETSDKDKRRSLKSDDGDEIVRSEFIVRPPDGGYGWVVCFCAFISFFVVDGILFSSGMFLDKIVNSYKTSSALASVVMAVTFGMHYLLGPVCSACMRAIGLRPTAIIGAVLTSTALGLAAAKPPFWVLVVLVGGIGGLGMCFLFMTSVAIVTNYFSKLRIYALGIIGTGTGLGTLVFAHLSAYMAYDMTWAQVFLSLSAFSAVLIFLVLAYRPIKPVRLKDVLNERETETSERGAAADSDLTDSEIAARIKRKRSRARRLKKKKVKKIVRLKKALKKIHGGCMRWCTKCSGRVGSAKNAVVNSLTKKKKTGQGKSKRVFKLPSLKNAFLKKRASKVANAMSGRSRASAGGTGPGQHKLGGVEMPKQLEEFVHDVFDMRELNNIHVLAFCLSGGLGAAGFMVAYTYEAERTLHDGFGQEYGTAVVAFMGAMNILWRLQLGFISEIPGIPYHFVYHLSMISAGTLTVLSTYYTSNFFKIAFATVFSFGQACFAVYRPAMLMEIVHHEKLSNVSGINLLFMGVMAIPGPPLAGWFKSLHGNFDVAFWFSGGLMLLSALVFLPTTLIRVLHN